MVFDCCPDLFVVFEYTSYRNLWVAWSSHTLNY